MTRIQSVRVAFNHHHNNSLTIHLLGSSKITGKKGLIKKWKARKEKAKLEKIEKMKSTLRKLGLIVNEDVKTVEIDPIEQKPAEPKIKFYGKETLPAV